MAIDILSAGQAGTHSFKKVNVNYEDDFIYFRDANMPSSIGDGKTYIYADGIGDRKSVV